MKSLIININLNYFFEFKEGFFDFNGFFILIQKLIVEGIKKSFIVVALRHDYNWISALNIFKFYYI